MGAPQQLNGLEGKICFENGWFGGNPIYGNPQMEIKLIEPCQKQNKASEQTSQRFDIVLEKFETLVNKMTKQYKNTHALSTKPYTDKEWLGFR